MIGTTDLQRYLQWLAYGPPLIITYSYFEKGCRKKCTRQSRKVLWVILRSLFFKESQDRMAREAMDSCLRVLKESNKSRFDSQKVRNSVLLISHITLRDCRVQFFPTTFLEIAVYKTSQNEWVSVNMFYDFFVDLAIKK